VIVGEANEDDILAELNRDNTANGQKFAAAARAAIPTKAAKSKAWNTLVETEEYSNTLINSASLAFGRVVDLELLSEYQEKYLSSALKIWESRSYHIAAYLLNNLYPVQLGNQALADATKKLIESDEIAQKPALRRILVENLANLERALSAQKVDN
jgi:aminopeptidase N